MVYEVVPEMLLNCIFRLQYPISKHHIAKLALLKEGLTPAHTHFIDAKDILGSVRCVWTPPFSDTTSVSNVVRHRK